MHFMLALHVNASPAELRLCSVLSFPSFVSGSQKIIDFLGVAIWSQQFDVLFAALKRTNLWAELQVNLVICSCLQEWHIYEMQQG
ncbi:hypothetical protein [Methanosarcina horonobensis]|uniref:hypothetical protein n=1 Tax=Methanosarcina horonobensis TaxID=418008 RepID=UPI0022B8F397|nr:hypothetical protein [Methanosarcina horonobensis]